jgi:hypothetical protein
VHARARRSGALGQALGLLYICEQFHFDHFGRDAVVARIMVHLFEVGAIAEAPRFGERPGLAGIGEIFGEFGLVEEPRQLRPASEPLLHLDAIGLGRSHERQQISRSGLLTNRLGTKEYRTDRLFDLPEFQPRLLTLDRPGLFQFAFEHGRPIIALTFSDLVGRNAGQLSRRLRYPALMCRKEHVRSHQRRFIPLFGVSERECEGSQNSARSLEAV